MEERIWHKAYPPSVPPSLDYEKITLPDALARTAAKYPDIVALILMGKSITYRRLDDYVNRFAAALSDLGIQQGEKVALILPNIPQIVIATYAVWRLGAVVVMNNPLYTERELEHQLNDSESRMAIAMDLVVPRVLSLKAKTGIKEVISCHIRDFLPFPLKQIFPFVKKELHRATDPSEGVRDFLDVLQSGAPEPPKTEVAFDDLAMLMYTGGTTGVSKGVMLTHANISINVQQLKCWLWNAREGNETVIGVLPFFHAAGLTAGMNHCIYRGFTHVLMPKPDTGLLVKYIAKYRPAIFGCVPTMYVGLLNHPKLPPKSELTFIKGCLSGAAPLAVDTIREWDDRVGVPICEVYGMTEMSPVAHANPWAGKSREGSVGVPICDTDCRIVDVETGEKEMPAGESGEILLKGPQQMKGYFNRPDETSASLKDGFFCTGDIGYMDEEGYLYVVDRKKDMIIAGGFNIYPREIDEVLYEHPKIQDACAVGLPDPYRGETVKAYIVLKDGQSMTEEEVIAYCLEKMTPYKVPRLIEFMDDLPKSAIGKVMRRELRDMEMARTAEKS